MVGIAPHDLCLQLTSSNIEPTLAVTSMTGIVVEQDGSAAFGRAWLSMMVHVVIVLQQCIDRGRSIPVFRHLFFKKLSQKEHFSLMMAVLMMSVCVS